MHTSYHRTLVSVLAILMLLALLLPFTASTAPTTAAQSPDGPPFSFPIAGEPGPNTWLYEQHYGNTTTAFNYGDVWYIAGQGMHFGLDIEVPCGTPVLAIADGVVAFSDDSSFGSEPHNIVLDHPGTGYVSLYGHLQQPPTLQRGDTVERGQRIGLSGDPDGSCESRPHLHLEIRSEDYQRAYNPLPFFEQPWHMLASIGPFVNPFQQDLDAPYRWLRIEDQPDVQFSGNFLNSYLRPWPPRVALAPPPNATVRRTLDPLPEDVTVTREVIAQDVWNIGAWWYPDETQAVYIVDAVPGEGSGVFRQPLDGSPREYVQPTPPPLRSPDGRVSIERISGDMLVTDRDAGETYDVLTQGSYPSVSPDGERLLWQVYYGDIYPGQQPASLEVWVSNLDGSGAYRAYTQPGGAVQWLDEHRLLIIRPTTYLAETTLRVLDLDADDPQAVDLGTYRYLRDVQVAPGGGWIAFWTPFQENPADSGIYLQRTLPGSEPAKLGFFGAYRWRDSRSLYTLSFDGSTDVHTLG
ncbi:MAG: M23 family metallopeptidase, partial [Chloroflexi bacterium]|nr:M23 family metallopeptidase [Chloroflexota bacterium]